MYVAEETTTTSRTALERIWDLVRDEVTNLQIVDGGTDHGRVVNPICEMPYAQNSACAGLVFATEFLQGGGEGWLTRARLALHRVIEESLAGVDEPKWNRLGWHHNRGSLFVTGTLLDAAWQAEDILPGPRATHDLQPLVQYLQSCKLGGGSYAHDSIRPGHLPASVQNTTAIALFLMDSIVVRTGGDAQLVRDRDMAIRSLINGQRSDGFWPYVEPNPIQRLAAKSPLVSRIAGRTPVARRYFIGTGDRSIFFGDAVHHCLVVFYAAKSLAMRPDAPSAGLEAVRRGWEWTKHFLIPTPDGGLRFDFEWEPRPSGFRHGNFCDTSTYFLILGMLPSLVRLGFMAPAEAERTARGILKHVEHALLGNGAYPTAIAPYEGPNEVLRLVLPRVGEASAWKAALLAEFILGGPVSAEVYPRRR